MSRSIHKRSHAKPQTDRLIKDDLTFRVLLQALDDVVWFADFDGNFLFVNDAVERIYGRTSTEFYDNPRIWLDVVYSQDRKIAEQSESDLMEFGSADVEYRIVRSDGGIVWLHDRKYVVSESQNICGITTDITARR